MKKNTQKNQTSKKILIHKLSTKILFFVLVLIAIFILVFLFSQKENDNDQQEGLNQTTLEKEVHLLEKEKERLQKELEILEGNIPETNTKEEKNTIEESLGSVSIEDFVKSVPKEDGSLLLPKE